MDDAPPTTADLLASWRDATRAAELTERLAEMAADAARQADENALASERIATMAERAARSAERAAENARSAATRARALATRNRQQRVAEVNRALEQARTDEIDAGRRYHDAEHEARDRHPD